MALQLHRSNRSERLVDALAEVVRRPLRDPLAPELIAVQSKGMERWLAFELSARLSLFANAELPFPRHLVSSLMDAALGEEEDRHAAWSEQALALAIAAVLPERLGHPTFAPLADYLTGGDRDVLLLQLSTRLARAFDDYAVYRPQLMQAFGRGEGVGFEAELVRALVVRHGAGHQAARVARWIETLQRGGAQSSLPERVCVFGVASLPPLYLDALSALAEHVETHVFVLTPCKEYYGGGRRAQRGDEASAQVGHPLLASLGTLGRDLQDLLEERARYDERSELFEEPGQDTLLHALQSDMLHLRDRGGATRPDLKRSPIAPEDRSISIHVCHGPMREVEVLHDQLVALLEEQPDVAPHQIVVMTPDIERYAPMIEAVFGAESARMRIPFSVADRRPRSSFEVVHAFGLLLDALCSRLHGSTLIDLLAVPCIGARAGIAAAEIDTLRELVEQSGARLGADSEHRAELGLPRTPFHTWRFALDRLLLGLAIEARPESTFAGVGPVEGGHGSEAELVGKLAAFCERLFAARKQIADARSLDGWNELLSELLSEAVAATPENAGEHALVRAGLAGLREDAARVGFTAAVSLASVRTLLEDRLDARMPARGLLARGVTFCQLVPMRSIPFEVVCLLGMNDGEFPRASTPLAFERSAEHGKPQSGDRSPRDDDRHMVLEAILCARRRLLVSHVGFGNDDNRPRPASVVVAELIDAIDRGFHAEGAADLGPGSKRRQALIERLCVEHKLHAWSARYFDRSDPQRLFSYSARACEAARALGERELGRTAEPELVAPTTARSELELEDLVRWVTRPLATFAERRLGLYLREDPDPTSDREPFELAGLEQWKLGMRGLDMRLRGVPRERAREALRVNGALPHGTAGDLALARLEARCDALAEATQAARAGAAQPPVFVAFEHAGVRVRGTLHDLFPGGQVTWTLSRAGRRHELEAYVRHVVLGCHLAHGGDARQVPTRIVCPGEGDTVVTVSFEPLDDPWQALAQLLSVVRAAETTALPFEHEVSRAYAEVRARPKRNELEAALRSARGKFPNKQESKSKGTPLDPYVERFFPTFEALTAARPCDFTMVAEAAFSQLLRCRRLR